MQVIKHIKKNAQLICLITLIIIIGLLPLNWFIPGHVITGGDLDFPIFPINRFIERLFVWNPIIRAGTSEAHNFTTLFFTGVEAFFNLFTPNAILVEKFTFVAWYTGMGFAILFAINTIFGNKRYILKLAAIIFWLFNFYQIYAWEIFRLDEIAALAALPPIIALYVAGLQKKVSVKKVIIALIPLSFIASSIATNPTVALPIPFAFIIFFIVALLLKKTSLKYAFKFSTAFAAVILLLNTYWILPFIQKVHSESLATQQAKESIYKADDMLKWTTANNSFLNITRSYGDVFLYDGYAGDPYLPFFETYKHSRVLEGLSFLLPMLAFLGLASSTSYEAAFFGFLALFALWFSKGPHEPFGNIYLFLRQHIPVFWTIRAPWQKFSVLTTLSYTVLAALFVENIYFVTKKIFSKNNRKLQPTTNNQQLLVKLFKREYLPIAISVLPPIVTVFYMQGFIKGGQFPRPGEQKVMPPYYSQIPNYVQETFNWLNSQEGEFKILMLPEEKANIYTWGYGAPKAIEFNYSNKPILFQQYGEGSYTPHPIDKRTAEIYRAIYSGSGETAIDLMQNLGVKYLLQRNDFRHDFYGDNDSPAFIKEKLSTITGIELAKTFGEWDIYQLTQNPKPLFYQTQNLFLTSPQASYYDLYSLGYKTGTTTSVNKRVKDNTPGIYGVEPIIEKDNKGKINIAFNTQFVEPGIYNGYINGEFYQQYNIEPQQKTTVKMPFEELAVTNNSLNLETQRKNLMGASIRLENFTPNEYSYYKISFDYKFSSNNDPKLYIYETNEPQADVVLKPNPQTGDTEFFTSTGKGDLIVLNFVDLVADDNWHNKEVFIEPNAGTKALGILILNEPRWGSITQTNEELAQQELKNINIGGFVKSELILKAVTNSEQGAQATKYTPLIAQRINSTKYKLNLPSTSEPYWLVFSQNYDNGWKLVVNGKAVKPEEHISANGYANAWKVEQGGKAVLEFWPQRLFYYGLIITIGTLVGLAVFICLNTNYLKRS